MQISPSFDAKTTNIKYTLYNVFDNNLNYTYKEGTNKSLLYENTLTHNYFKWKLYESEDYMSISLDAPIKMTTFRWPTSEIGQTVPEEEGDLPDEVFMTVDSWTDGGFVNAQGYFIGEDINGIEVGLDEDSFNENKIDFHVWNNPDSGISFADGNTVKTRLCISKAGWYYIYNVTLMSQDAYKAAGISAVKAAKTGNGLVYNLAGQRVDASYKGLVIKAGKKAIQK